MNGLSFATEEFRDLLGDDVHHARVFDTSHEGLRGFGSAPSREVAMLKAYSEYCERASMLSLAASGERINSNGFAVHQSRELARAAAVAEIIERDLVMSCWLSRRSPEWLNELPTEWSVFEKSNVEAKVGKLGSINGTSVYVSMLLPRDRRQFGFVFSSSANRNASDALRSLYFTQRRNLTAALSYLASGEKFPTLEEVKSPQSHRNYHLNPERADSWQWMLAGKEALADEKLQVKVSDVAIPFPTSWPLFAARAESLRMQNYFTGLPKTSKLNFSRLSTFGIETDLQINQDVHPLP